MPSHLMTVQEAAQFLSVSVSTLYGWAWQRKIPFVKVGRALRFDRADLERFIRANRFEARNESPRTIGPSVA
jgi:excisionase family DNA binding protein